MTAGPAPSATLERADVLAMLAGYGDRGAGQVGEELGSLEVTWLVAQVEQRHGLVLDLSDDEFAEMTTVTDAVRVLRGALAGAGPATGG
ncbi:MAG TPA: hypothetical protein VGD67_00515 [Pseudonocardiaceae bacterium]